MPDPTTPAEAAALPSWATITPLGDGRWRLDLDGHIGDAHTRLKGSAIAGSPEPLHRLVDTIAAFQGDDDA